MVKKKKRTLISAANRPTTSSSTTEATAGGSSELPPSALAVVSNEDLLTEILLRLPAISLILFKSVSKRWLSLIRNPNFTFRRSKNPRLDPPSGIFLSDQKICIGYEFVPLDTRIPNYTYCHYGTSSFTHFLHSCNGLILLRMSRSELHVYNPSMNIYKKLPEFDGPDATLFSHFCSLLAFDPTKSPHYKVVKPVFVYVNGVISFRILIYSSETSDWNVCGAQFSVDSFRDGFQEGMYLNGSFYWLKEVGVGCLVYKLDIERVVLTTIQTPTTLEGKEYCNHKLFESRGCLLLACTSSPHPKHLYIYEMSNDYSGWLVKYTVNLDDIRKTFPKTRRLSLRTRRFCSSVRCIVLGEREEDSFLVIERSGLVLKYKIVLKTVHLLHDMVSKLTTNNRRSFQFIASFAGV